MVKYDFYIHTYDDDPTQILDQIKQFHPSARAILISDGGKKDWNTQYFHKFADRLENKSSKWITRWWDVTRIYNSDFIIRVDPDSTISGSFKDPFPLADYFGHITSYHNFGEEKKFIIHAGFGLFITKRFVNLVYDQVTDEKFLKKEFMYRNTLVSNEKILAYLASQNDILPVEYDSGIKHKARSIADIRNATRDSIDLGQFATKYAEKVRIAEEAEKALQIRREQDAKLKVDEDARLKAELEVKQTAELKKEANRQRIESLKDSAKPSASDTIEDVERKLGVLKSLYLEKVITQKEFFVSTNSVRNAISEKES